MRRMALAGLALVACFMPALMAAGAVRKMPPPLPKPKPAEYMRPGSGVPADSPSLMSEEPVIAEPEAVEAPPAEVGAIVIPREKPVDLGKTEPPQIAEPEAGEVRRLGSSSSAMIIPREKPVEMRRPAPGMPPEPKSGATQDGDDEKPEPGEEFATCRRALAELGAAFKIPDMPPATGKCKVPNPVQITTIASPAGRIDFPGQPILNCIFAKQFTTWVSDVAGPVVKAQTGEALVAISTGPGYECRGRNGDGTGKISEHAFGNAVDIASFRLASKESMPVANVAKTGNVESRWLMALRISACGYFTTVLGPGSNAAHAEHYHFDLGLHGRSGNYKICE